MPKQVDHQERRETIAQALWDVVEQRGIAHASIRNVAQAAGISHGAVQHYFTTREDMLAFAMDFASHRTTQRVTERITTLQDPPHPRDTLRIMLTETLPLHSDARATSRMSAAYVLEALHNTHLHAQARDGLTHGRNLIEQTIRQAITDGHIAPDRDPATETNLLLALTGLTPLLELDVITPQDALAAIDQHLDRLFTDKA